jgi:hypothetical protein
MATDKVPARRTLKVEHRDGSPVPLWEVLEIVRVIREHGIKVTEVRRMGTAEDAPDAD